jgi:acyl-CoA thioesterase I
VKSKEGFVSLLQSSLTCAVTNISRFGNTIMTAMPKLRRDLEKEKPDVVLIELGGNDCDYKWAQIAVDPHADHRPATEAAVFEEKLNNLVGSLRADGVAPVLMTLPPIDADRYFSWISKSGSEAATHILQWLGSVTRIYWWQEKYNAMVVNVAERTHTERIDLRSAFLHTPDFRKLLCKDGIHPNKEGHALISRTIADFLSVKCPELLRPTTPGIQLSV